MKESELATLKAILANNPEYSDSLNSILEAEALKAKEDVDLDIDYGISLPFRYNLNALRDLYRAHGSDPDFRDLAVEIIDENANQVMKYMDKVNPHASKPHDKIIRILMGESIKVSAILGMNKTMIGELDLGEMFRSKPIHAEKVTDLILGGLSTGRWQA